MHLTVYNDVHNCIRLCRFRDENGINDMNHTIICNDIGRCDLRLVDEHAIFVDGHHDVFFEKRSDLLSIG